MKLTRSQIIAYIIVAVVVTAIGCYALYNYSKKAIDQNSDLSTPQEVEKKSIPENLEGVSLKERCNIDPTLCEKVKTYRSEKLGVEFQVHETAKIIEEGNRIYVEGKEGQYVEILPKYSLQTPLQKVEELNGPTAKYCITNEVPAKDFSEATSSGMEDPPYPLTYSLVYNYSNEKDFDRTAEGKTRLCQSQWAGLNGMVLFIADSEHPTKIAFFSIGQYSIPAGPDLMWQHTFRFIK